MSHEIVAALIIRSGRVLLGHRSAMRTFYPDVWDIFGGHLEPGEAREGALVRELQEELGITPTGWTFLETVAHRASLAAHQDEPSAALTVHLFLVTAWKGAPRNRQPEEHCAIGWFSLARAKGLSLADPSYPMLFARYMDAA